MATSKLPEVPSSSNLPKPSSSARDDVFVDMEKFVGGVYAPRDEKGIPTLLGERQMRVLTTDGIHDVHLSRTLDRIENIPQWQKGLAKPEVKAEWDSFFSLLPKWIENVFERLNEKNHTFKADEDASDESREINWMKGRLSALQTAIDFAAQEAIAAPPSPAPAPAPSPAPSAAPGPAPGPSAGPSAAPSGGGSQGAPAPSGTPPKAESAKKGETPWMLYAAGGLIALVVLSQMNRR